MPLAGRIHKLSIFNLICEYSVFWILLETTTAFNEWVIVSREGVKERDVMLQIRNPSELSDRFKAVSLGFTPVSPLPQFPTVPMTAVAIHTFRRLA